MPLFSKRKRTRQDMRCVLFPEDIRETFIRRGTCETPKAVQSSWERCGDSFLDTPGMEKHDAARCTNRAVQQLAQTSTSVSPGSGDEDPVHIAWTSSDDEQSDDEPQLPLPPFAVTLSTGRARPAVSKSSRYMRFLSTVADPGELPTIDSESEHEDVSTTSQQISAVAAEISDYSSHSDGDPDPSRLDLPSEQRQRSVSEWVRSAQALLQTPPKQTEMPSKTPEDSGKKKRRFESRGYAERLNRLQCRQKSAISFWRHQPMSGITTEERPGLLVLDVQMVWEVCGMQAALCLRQPERQTCVALFSKETAAQLAPGAGDTVHIYPPWQSLSVDGEPHPIILNTHFSQKVSGAMKQDSSGTCLKVLCLNEKTKPYPLTRCLWKREETPSPASIPNVQTNRDVGTASESLLEALDACGTSGSVCGPVEVVVQRIYCYSVAAFPHASLRRRGTISKCLSGTAQREHVSRWCFLVQDIYGMFSEVEMQSTSSEEELKDFTEKLQGKVCLLQGLKVIQRLTRERPEKFKLNFLSPFPIVPFVPVFISALRQDGLEEAVEQVKYELAADLEAACGQLFSLIDSLWPPAVPLRVPGEGSCYQTVTAAAPSFCYRLSGRRDLVLVKHESPLYRPPFQQTLCEILQDEPARRLCSFKGDLVYKREQDDEEKDLLLFVTDSSLQDEQSSGSISRTLPVYVSSTLLLQTPVRQAVAALSPRFRPRLVFRDVLMEQGKIVISRQSVVQLDSEASGNQNGSLLQSVLLDRLTPESPPCSLCTVTGVVMDIDENSAFSWPVCRHCESESLEAFENKQNVFLCVSCGVVDKPSKKMQLEVFLSCPSRHWTVKVKLHQNSIMSLLNATAQAEGYEVEAVLGKHIGPLNAFIHVVTRGSSALWMALEEINL